MEIIKSKHSISTYVDINGLMHLSDEDASVELIRTADLYSQKMAITRVLQMISDSENEISKDITKLEQKAKLTLGSHRDFLVDQTVDLYHLSVYFDAANSMSVLGMLAPTVESILYEVFINIGNRFGSNALIKQSERLNSNDNKYVWDCHYEYKRRKYHSDLFKGIKQLTHETGLIIFHVISCWRWMLFYIIEIQHFTIG